jgi:hypothetical protein
MYCNRERVQHTFPSRRSDGNAVSWLKKLSLGNGVVHLRFEDPEEAVLAYLLSGLWTPQNGFRVLAEGTALRCHDRKSSQIVERAYILGPAVRRD